MKEGKIEGIGGRRQGRRKAGKVHVRRERGEGQGRKVGKCTSLGYT